MAGVMEVAQMAGSILSAAAKIYQIVQEVRHFKNRSQRFKKRIENLVPIVEKLDSSDQEVPAEARTPDGLKIYIKGLKDLLQLIKSSSKFIESLQEKSFLNRLLHKNKYSDRFNQYSEELDSLSVSLQLGLAVEAREVIYDLMRTKDDGNDEMEDEASLLNEFKKDQEKILEDIGKQKEGDEIRKSIEELESKVSSQSTQKGQSLTSKQPSTAEGLKEIDYNELKDVKEIASGCFGRTYQAKYMRQDVTLKSYLVGFDKKEKDILLQEAKTLTLLNSTYIVRILGVCTKKEPYLLVLEFMSEGKLRDVLNKVGGDLKILPWERRIKLSLDGALGLYRMHNTRPSLLLHQDLASDNFLVDENWRMKLSGVGFAKTQTSILKKTKQTSTGRSTLNYVSPERLENISRPNTASTDVYSYGIVMWEIATGSKPYEGKSDDDIKEFVLTEKKKLPLPSDCPGVFKNLIDQCREFDPLVRPTSSEIVDKLQKYLDEF